MSYVRLYVLASIFGLIVVLPSAVLMAIILNPLMGSAI